MRVLFVQCELVAAVYLDGELVASGRRIETEMWLDIIRRLGGECEFLPVMIGGEAVQVEDGEPPMSLGLGLRDGRLPPTEQELHDLIAARTHRLEELVNAQRELEATKQRLLADERRLKEAFAKLRGA